MLDFTSQSPEELRAKIAKFNEYVNTEDPVTMEPIHRPCRFILEDDEGNQSEGMQVYNADTLDKLVAAASEGSEARCPFTRMKIVGKKDVVEGSTLIRSIFNALKEAIVLGKKEEIAVWLAAGGDPNHALYVGLGALFLHPEILALLLEKGCNRCNMFTIAASWGCTEIIALLLEKGANIHQLEGDGLFKGLFKGQSTLFIAAANGHTETVALLLEKGADIHQLQGEGPSKGQSALFAAAANGHTPTVALLLEKGAHIYPGTLHRAVLSGRTEIVALFIGKGVNIFAPYLDTIGRTNENSAALDLIKRKKEAVKRVINYITHKIFELKNLGVMTAFDAMELPMQDDLTQIFLERWHSITKIKRPCDEISATLAQTNLSVEQIDAAIAELNLPNPEQEASSSMTQTAAPVLHMAPSRKRSTDSDEPKAKSSRTASSNSQPG